MAEVWGVFEIPIPEIFLLFQGSNNKKRSSGQLDVEYSVFANFMEMFPFHGKGNLERNRVAPSLQDVILLDKFVLAFFFFFNSISWVKAGLTFFQSPLFLINVFLSTLDMEVSLLLNVKRYY